MILSRLLSKRASPENPSTPLSVAADWLIETLGGGTSVTGKVVTPSTAMRLTAVYASVRVIAETIASLPLFVFKSLDGGGKERQPGHPLHSMLHDQPNEQMSSFTFREALMSNVLLWGTAYAAIERTTLGVPTELILWPSASTTIKVEGGERFGVIRLANGTTITKPVRDMLVIPGLGFDGLQGQSPISLARESIGLSLAAEEYGAAFFGRGAQPGGILEHPKLLNDQAHKRLRQSIDNRHAGLGNAHKTMILEQGMTWRPVGIPQKDAQFLETRKFQVNEVARLFRVPPHMIGDLDRATFSNVEQQSIDFVIHTIRPWLVKLEQEYNRKLFTGKDGRPFFVQFVVDALLRGDTKSRFESYAIARTNGWINVNEIRRLENMVPIGEEGDTFMTPMNMQELGAKPDAQPAPDNNDKQDDTPDRSVTSNRFAPLFADAVSRCESKERKSVKAARKRYDADPDGLVSWSDKFYADHRTMIVEALKPAALACADEVVGTTAMDITIYVGEYLTELAQRCCTTTGQDSEEITSAMTGDFVTRLGARKWLIEN